MPGAKQLVGRLWPKFQETQKAWHGTPHKVEQNALGDYRRHINDNYDDLSMGGGTYFSPMKDMAQDYQKLFDNPRNPGGTLIRAEIPDDQYLLDYNRMSSQPPYVRERLKKMAEEDPEFAKLLRENDPAFDFHQAYDEHMDIMDDKGVQLLDLPSRLDDAGIPGSLGSDEINIYSHRNIRELGRNMVPLAVGGGAMAASQESEAMPTGRMYNGEDEELDPEAVATLDRIRSEPPGIYGPQHPRMLGGIDAVRSIPGADFVAGGVLDLASEYAWGRNPSKMQHAMAGLEVGGGAVGGMVGRMASKAGRSLGLGRRATNIDETINTSDYMDEIITDADYPRLEPKDDDDIANALQEQFQRQRESYLKIRNERSNFPTEMEAQAARRQKENPTAWMIQPGRSGYGLVSYSGGKGRQNLEIGRQIKAQMGTMSDQDFRDYANRRLAETRFEDLDPQDFTPQ